MPLNKDNFRTKGVVVKQASVLFTQIMTYQELSGKRKNQDELNLQYYLGFKILDSLYRFQGDVPEEESRDTKFSDENCSEMFLPGQLPAREQINALRNRIIHGNKMVFDQAALDEVNRVVSYFKNPQDIELGMHISPLTEAERSTYVEACNKTKQYVNFIGRQCEKFGVDPLLTRSEILDSLKGKETAIKEKYRLVDLEVKRRGIILEIRAPKLGDTLSELDDITKELIHGIPQLEIVGAASSKLDEVERKLSNVYDFLDKTPEKIVTEAIDRAEKKLEKEAKARRNEELNRLQSRQTSERETLFAEEGSGRESIEFDQQAERGDAGNKLAQRIDSERRILEISDQIKSLEEKKMTLVIRVAPLSNELKEKKEVFRSSEFITKSVDSLHKIFQQYPKDQRSIKTIETVRDDFLTKIYEATDPTTLEAKVAEYIASNTNLTTERSTRSAGGRSHVGEVSITIAQTLAKNPDLARIFELTKNLAEIRLDNLTIGEDLKRLESEKQKLLSSRLKSPKEPPTPAQQEALEDARPSGFGREEIQVQSTTGTPKAPRSPTAANLAKKSPERGGSTQ